MKAGEKLRAAGGARWERRAAALLVVATVAGVACVVAAQPPLGVPGQHCYPYHPAPQWGAVGVLLCVAVPLVAGLVFAFLWRRELTHIQQTLVVAVLSAGSLFLHAGTGGAGKLFPGAQLVWPFLWSNTEGAYAQEAGAAKPVGRFVSDYVHRLDVSPHRGTPHWVHIHHSQVHPPALILAFVGVEWLYDRLPGLRARMTRWIDEEFPTSKVLRPSQDSHRIRHPLAVAMTAALVALAMVSFLPLLGFVAARELWPTRTALIAAGLAALVPGTHLFSPSVDQAYPAVTLLLCWLAFRTARTRGCGAGLALGAAVYGAMFVHVGFALVVGILAVAGGVAWRAERPQWRVGEVVRGYWRPAVAAAFGFLTPAFVLLVWLGYPTFRVILLCLRNNAQFNAAAGRTWWPWVAVAPFEFAVSLGFALLLVVAVGWVAEAAAAVRARSLRGRAPMLLAAGGVLLALHLLGFNRGETARLWLFLTPLLVLGAVGYLERRAAGARVLLGALCAAQLVQVAAFSIAMDLGRTTTFLLDVIATQQAAGQ